MRQIVLQKIPTEWLSLARNYNIQMVNYFLTKEDNDYKCWNNYALSKRGIKITSYNVTDGAGRLTTED